MYLLPHFNRDSGVPEKPVAFWGEGAATKHMIKDRSKNGLLDGSVVCCDVVETRRINKPSVYVTCDPFCFAPLHRNRYPLVTFARKIIR